MVDLGDSYRKLLLRFPFLIETWRAVILYLGHGLISKENDDDQLGVQ